mmetsp:Transcript_30846/g.34395  ORF Transcript_30846/g.34395 Transcript_30846/m.34395 type:complete len:338 (+) Transcript_30846:21-1034(+)
MLVQRPSLSWRRMENKEADGWVEVPLTKVQEKRSTMRKLKRVIQIKDRSIRFKKYNKCFTGSDAVAHLREILKLSESDATEHATELMQAGFFCNIKTRGGPFENSSTAFYAFTKVPTNEELLGEISDAWAKKIMNIVQNNDPLNPTWELERDGEVKVCTCSLNNIPIRAIRVETVTTASAESLMQVLHTQLFEYHKEWNSDFISGEIVQTVNENVTLQHWKFTVKTSTVSDRDFLIVRRVWQDSMGKHYILDKSVKSGLMQRQKDFIRCTVLFQLRMIEQLDNGKVRLVHCNLTDLRGSIPAIVVNSANVRISQEQVKSIVAVAERECALLEACLDG